MIMLANGCLFVGGAIVRGELILSDRAKIQYAITDSQLCITAERSVFMKLDRNRGMFFAGFLESGQGKTAPTNVDWEVLGRDNDDLTKDLNPDTETSKNVLGETTFKHSGYEPSVNVDPYYADTTSALYSKLKAAAVQEKYGDEDIKGYFVEAVFDGTQSTEGHLTGTGYMREAYIVPESTGGDTAGYSIPFTVNPVGPLTTVTVDYTLATRAVTIAVAT